MQTYLSLDPRSAEDVKKIKRILALDLPWEKSTDPYVQQFARLDNLRLTLYTGGKLLLQGKGLEEFLSRYVQEHLATIDEMAAIAENGTVGADESGKGDFFGPLVTAAVYIPDERLIQELGLRDSKEMTDRRIMELADEIPLYCPVALRVLMPREYNKIYQSMPNLNKILAREHAANIAELLAKHKVGHIYIDQFSKTDLVGPLLKTSVPYLAETGAENKFPAVAAASIMARAYFVRGLEELSEEFGIALPKGAYQVESAGRDFIKRHGIEALASVAKIHFKTHEKLLRLFE